MRPLAVACALLCLTATARAQDEAAEPEDGAPGPTAPLPPPTLEEEEPVAPLEPLPAPEEEEREPQILTRIGPGQHPEWEDDADEEPPRDIAFETPGDLRSSQATATNRPGLRFDGQEPEEPTPPFVLAVGAGWARYLSTVALDFFRIEERFEATIPDFPILRIGAGAAQMFNENGYLVGGGVRLGLGTPFCDLGGVTCDGVAYVQPGFLAGLSGPRFDLDALLSVRINVERVFQLALEGGYSLGIEAVSMPHLSLSAGGLF